MKNRSSSRKRGGPGKFHPDITKNNFISLIHHRSCIQNHGPQVSIRRRLSRDKWSVIINLSLGLHDSPNILHYQIEMQEGIVQSVYLKPGSQTVMVVEALLLPMEGQVPLKSIMYPSNKKMQIKLLQHGWMRSEIRKKWASQRCCQLEILIDFYSNNLMIQHWRPQKITHILKMKSLKKIIQFSQQG